MLSSPIPLATRATQIPHLPYVFPRCLMAGYSKALVRPAVSTRLDIDPVPLIGKSRALCPCGRFPSSFIHQVIIIPGLNTNEVIRLYICSRPEDGLRCRQSVKPPLNLKTSSVAYCVRCAYHDTDVGLMRKTLCFRLWHSMQTMLHMITGIHIVWHCIVCYSRMKYCLQYWMLLFKYSIQSSTKEYRPLWGSNRWKTAYIGSFHLSASAMSLLQVSVITLRLVGCYLL